MTNKSKQKGTAWETAIVRYLEYWGFRAKRKVLSGNADKGDIELPDIPSIIIEAKNAGRYNIPQWVKEADTEAENAKVLIGVVWMHQNGKSNPADGFVIMSGDTFRRLLGILEG